MPPELSMSMRRDAAQAGAQVSTEPELTSLFEERIVRWLCQPLLPYIPRSVRPNSISLLTHGMSWLTAFLAVTSVHLPTPYRSLALFGAGLGMLMSMIGDCVDGMHARATDQCSKLGATMDHWLDAIVVPLAALGASLALELPPWAVVAVSITATMVYNGQLVLYHHTGKFVHPEPATGMEGQFGVSLGYVAFGALLYFVDRDQRWLDYAVIGIAVLALYIQMRCNGFYYARLGKLLRYHLAFVGTLSAFGALYLVGAIDLYAFASCLVFASFRVCGTYVLYTVVERPYGGGDLGVIAFICAIAGAHFLLPSVAHTEALTLQTLLPYLACVYMLARNLLDFSRHYAVFQPTPL